ncbi:MAG: hypothetical protein HYX69_00095 [Planctomycetia bacterium]|nr:hypothetical protein [Planctomycetia bacterium]
MRIAMLLATVLSAANLFHDRPARGAPLEVTWLIQYGNETLQTADLSGQPRMLRNISNSLMTAAPSYLNDSIYLQRRSDFINLFPELNGIGETSQEWLRPNRVTVSQPAVVVAAVREDDYPGAGALLENLGWTALGQTATLGYVAGVANLQLYAGLVDAGPVQISGAGVNDLRVAGIDGVTSSDYFFFQSLSAFSPDTLAGFNRVSVPEPTSLLLAALACLGLANWSRGSRR